MIKALYLWRILPSASSTPPPPTAGAPHRIEEEEDQLTPDLGQEYLDSTSRHVANPWHKADYYQHTAYSYT
jgi:hypothetical protein